jgi:hypothetical protein
MKTPMKNICALLVGMLTFACFAQTTVGLHLGSVHGGNPPCDNGNNPGVYVGIENGLVVGTYRNSCERQSFYAGYKPPDWHGVGVILMGVTGYEAKVTFVALPTVAFGSEDFRVRVSGGAWDGWAVVHFSTEWRF